MWSFLLVSAPNFINDPVIYCCHWVKSFLTATLFRNSQNIFQMFGTPREQQKLFLTHFNLKKILSSLALEAGTVNNNLITNSMLL